MRSDSRVDDGPRAIVVLVQRVPRVGVAARVRGQEGAAGEAVLEAHHAVLPVADVVAEAHAQHRLAEVVRVKEEPKGVEDAGALVYEDEDGWCGRVAFSVGFVAAREERGCWLCRWWFGVGVARLVLLCAVGDGSKVGGHVGGAVQPVGALLYVLLALEEDGGVDVVEAAEVVECPGGCWWWW